MACCDSQPCFRRAKTHFYFPFVIFHLSFVIFSLGESYQHMGNNGK
jgi:hypothetical protein